MHDPQDLEKRTWNEWVLKWMSIPLFVNCFLFSTENLAECVNKVNETGRCYIEGEVKLVLHFVGGWHSTDVDLYTCCSYLVLHLLLKSEMIKTHFMFALHQNQLPNYLILHHILTFIRGFALLFGISEWECSSFTATPYSAFAGHSSHTFTVAWVTSPGYLLHSCTSSGLVGLKHSTMCRLCLTPCGSEQDIICLLISFLIHTNIQIYTQCIIQVHMHNGSTLWSEQRGWLGCLFLQYAWEDLCKVLTVLTTLGEVFTDVPLQTCPTVVAQNLWLCGLGSPLESAGWWSPPSHLYQKSLPPHHTPSVRVNNERAYPVKGVCMWCDSNTA